MIARIEPSTIAFFLGYVVFVAIRGNYDRGGSARRGTVDMQEALVMTSVGLGMMVAPIVYLATPLLDFADYASLEGATWAGAFVMAASLLLFWRSHADLGRSFSRTTEIRDNHELITHGVYSVLRHPMYAAIWLFGLAQALLLPNWVAGLGGVVGFAPMYFLRTPREEAMMAAEFGERYREYARRTGRVIPRVTRQ